MCNLLPKGSTSSTARLSREYNSEVEYPTFNRGVVSSNLTIRTTITNPCITFSQLGTGMLPLKQSAILCMPNSFIAERENMREKRCEKCGKWFRPDSRSDQRFCNKCRKRIKIEKICPVCKKNFPYTHGNQKYCCTECAVFGKKIQRIKREMYRDKQK